MSEIPPDGRDWEPSKPADIPDDVWMSARRGMDYASKRQELIARAIMAETERCAKIADAQAEREEYGHAKHAAITIAQNIREGR